MPTSRKKSPTSKNRCKRNYCRNLPKTGEVCNTCRTREWRNKNPMRSAYLNLRNNSKRRGKIFKLTWEQFKRFCYQSDYIAGKGKTKESYTIDRKENDKGYVEGNLQILTLEDNSRKGNRKLEYDWQYQHASVHKITPPIKEGPNLPF